MNNIRKIALPVLAVLMTAGVSFAQDAKEVTITASEFRPASNVPVVMKKSEDGKLRISFDVTVPEDYMHKGLAYVVQPSFRNGDWRYDLPVASVEGRRYSIVTNDRIRFEGDDTEYLLRLPYTGEELTYHYQAEVAYQPEMKGAELILLAGKKRYCAKVHLCPCQKETKVTRLANGVTDYSDFVTNDPMLYLVPEYEAGEYVNSFGNKSVFRVGRYVIDYKIFNAAGYNDFVAEVKKKVADPNTTINVINITTAASPEGRLAWNTILAEKRANSVDELVRKDLPEIADAIELTSIPENWEAFEEVLNGSGLANLDRIKQIIATESDLDAREAKLKQLSNYGEIYRVFQNLRSCQITVAYTVRELFPKELEIGGQPYAAITLGEAPVSDLSKIQRLYNAEPTTARANNMMVALMERGQYDEALVYAEKISNKNICPIIANNKAVLYAVKNEPLMSETLFNVAADVPYSDYNEGLMLMQRGDYDRAAVLMSGYDNPNAVVSSLYADQYRQAAAQTHIATPTIESLYLRAVAYAQNGDDRLSLEALDQVCRADSAFKAKAANQAEFIRFRACEQFQNIIK